MLSIPVASLPILGQIFDHVEVSTQYDFMFGCDITSQFINKDFLLGWGGGGVYWECIYLLFEICFFVFDSNRYYTACFIRVFKFHFKVFRSFAKYSYFAFGPTER